MVFNVYDIIIIMIIMMMMMMMIIIIIIIIIVITSIIISIVVVLLLSCCITKCTDVYGSVRFCIAFSTQLEKHTWYKSDDICLNSVIMQSNCTCNAK